MKKALNKVPVKKEKNEPTPEQLIKALNNHRGNVTVTARALKCDRAAVVKMIETNPELKDIILRARESIIDEAEKSLIKNIQDGNVTSIIFVLKTLGRARGYVLNGNKPNELVSRINQAVLKRLSDEQLAELESLLKKKKDLTSFLEEIGLYASSD
jgi:hypothetical protein